MRTLLKIVLIVLGILCLLVAVFFILIMRSRNVNTFKEYDDPKKILKERQLDSLRGIAIAVVLAAACFWGATRL